MTNKGEDALAAIPKVLQEHINTAYPAHVCLIGTALPDGYAQITPRGSTMVYDDEHFALWERGKLVTAPAPKVVVKDTVGAGDAFMAGLMVGLTRGMDTRKVLENACRLGAFVASHDGATPLLPPELTAEFTSA